MLPASKQRPEAPLMREAAASNRPHPSNGRLSNGKGATMTSAATRYAVILGFAGALALTATTCSVAHSATAVERDSRVAQFCVPRDSWDVSRVFCRRNDA
jgi:hypothetical protein